MTPSKRPGLQDLPNESMFSFFRRNHQKVPSIPSSSMTDSKIGTTQHKKTDSLPQKLPQSRGILERIKEAIEQNKEALGNVNMEFTERLNQLTEMAPPPGKLTKGGRQRSFKEESKTLLDDIDKAIQKADYSMSKNRTSNPESHDRVPVTSPAPEPITPQDKEQNTSRQIDDQGQARSQTPKDPHRVPESRTARLEFQKESKDHTDVRRHSIDWTKREKERPATSSKSRDQRDELRRATSHRLPPSQSRHQDTERSASVQPEKRRKEPLREINSDRYKYRDDYKHPESKSYPLHRKHSYDRLDSYGGSKEYDRPRTTRHYSDREVYYRDRPTYKSRDREDYRDKEREKEKGRDRERNKERERGKERERDRDYYQSRPYYRDRERDYDRKDYKDRYDGGRERNEVKDYHDRKHKRRTTSPSSIASIPEIGPRDPSPRRVYADEALPSSKPPDRRLPPPKSGVPFTPTFVPYPQSDIGHTSSRNRERVVSSPGNKSRRLRDPGVKRVDFNLDHRAHDSRGYKASVEAVTPASKSLQPSSGIDNSQSRFLEMFSPDPASNKPLPTTGSHG